MAKILTLRRPTSVADLVRSHGLTGLVRPASAHIPHPDGVGERILPVLPELRGLFPAGGLRRGSTVLVGGSTSLLLSLLTSASSAGSWCAVVGMPDLGLVAAAEFGIALGRLALVPDPGPDWPAVVAALLDGIDVVVAAPPGPVPVALAGRLAARARQRGGVLVSYGRWTGADVVLEATAGGWSGLGRGRGRLCRHELVVSRRGRGAAALPRQAVVWIPRLGCVDPPGLGCVDPPGLGCVDPPGLGCVDPPGDLGRLHPLQGEQASKISRSPGQVGAVA